MHHSTTNSISEIDATRVSCPHRAQRLLDTFKTSLKRGQAHATATDSEWKHARDIVYQPTWCLLEDKTIEQKKNIGWRQIGRKWNQLLEVKLTARSSNEKMPFPTTIYALGVSHRNCQQEDSAAPNSTGSSLISKYTAMQIVETQTACMRASRKSLWPNFH